MTTPPPETSPRPASLAEQAATALDVTENILDVLDQVLTRLTALEHTHPPNTTTSDDGVVRSDYRFEHYPPPDADSEQRVRAAWERLDTWVDWLVATYKLTSVIPPCWPEHATLREELIGLHLAWTSAWSDTASPEAVAAFHDRLFRTRARLLDGNWGSPRCTGRHEDTGLDVADQYQAWARHPSRHHALITAQDRALTTIHKRQKSHGGEA